MPKKDKPTDETEQERRLRLCEKQLADLRKEFDAIEALSEIRYKAYRALLKDLEASRTPEIWAVLEKHRGNRAFFQVP